MYFYKHMDRLLFSAEEFSLFEAVEIPEKIEEEAFFITKRDPLTSRRKFSVSDVSQLFQEEESISWLDTNRMKTTEDTPSFIKEAIENGYVSSININVPTWEKAITQKTNKKKKRLNLLAVGDVGSTLLMGLITLGEDVIESIGICDLNENVTARWEYELNQIAYPWDYDRLPRVDVITIDELFNADVVAFCATKAIPAVGAEVKDVRMVQFEANAGIIKTVAKRARDAKFEGLLAVVSDPVDPLCKTAFLESNKNEIGELDFLGLAAEQIQGYGLGVMNARAAFFAKRDDRFSLFLTEGRSYGPHGGDLVVANSIENYDDELSKELTDLAVTANLKVRAVGYKPFVAPAFSSGAISIILTLRGEWHCSSTFMGGIFMGAKSRFRKTGLELEMLPLPSELFSRIEIAEKNLKKII